MRVHSFDWDNKNISHIGEHRVDPDEVEEAFQGRYYLYRTRDARYCLMGRSGVGRYLFIVFEYKGYGMARTVTARDMNSSEKKLYVRKIG